MGREAPAPGLNPRGVRRARSGARGRQLHPEAGSSARVSPQSLDAKTREYALKFKPLAEVIMKEKMSEPEFMQLVVGMGVERMVEDILNPRESSRMWDTIVRMLHDHPEAVVAFVSERLGAGPDDAVGGAAERWERYIG